MVTQKKNTSSLCLAVLMVAMATILLSCHAHKEMDHEPTAFPVPASCYSNYFPNCTDDRCKKFCTGDGKPPVSGAFCNDNSNCCCLVS
ncbi:unnamed protein product [Alopecurus aequalis]